MEAGRIWTDMTTRLPPLNQLRVFECVARHESFTSAAKELHITQGAVSHQMHALEDWLGFRLFDRHKGRLQITSGGAAYAKALGAAFSEVTRATEELVSVGSHQVLNVRGHTTFFTHWLIPLLPGFQKDCPGIRVRLAASVEWVDFENDQADVGIRYGDGKWEGLGSDLLFSDELTPVLSPQLAARLSQPLTAEALLTLPLLHSNRRPNHWRDWMDAAGCLRPPTAGDMYYEDLSIIYECAIQGLGVALGQRRYLERELAQGKLIAPCSFVLKRSRGYHLVYPKLHADDTKVVQFKRWLLAQI